MRRRGTLSILMVRRRVSAVSNHVARGPSFETPLRDSSG